MSLESFMDRFAFELGDLKGGCGGLVPLACAILSEDLQMLGLTTDFFYSWYGIMYFTNFAVTFRDRVSNIRTEIYELSGPSFEHAFLVLVKYDGFTVFPTT